MGACYLLIVVHYKLLLGGIKKGCDFLPPSTKTLVHLVSSVRPFYMSHCEVREGAIELPRMLARFVFLFIIHL